MPWCVVMEVVVREEQKRFDHIKKLNSYSIFIKFQLDWKKT